MPLVRLRTTILYFAKGQDICQSKQRLEVNSLIIKLKIASEKKNHKMRKPCYTQNQLFVIHIKYYTTFV